MKITDLFVEIRGDSAWFRSCLRREQDRTVACLFDMWYEFNRLSHRITNKLFRE
jgi:hypothetical protein